MAWGQREPEIDLTGFDLETLNEEPRVSYPGKMGNLISVSQLKLIPPSHKGCPRKWALMYLQKVPKKPNAALIDGIFLHRCIQDFFERKPEQWASMWRRGGSSPTGKAWSWYAELAMAMLRHVPEHERSAGVSEPTVFFDVPEHDTAIYIKPDFLNLRKFRDWKSTAAAVKTSPWVLQDPAWWPGGLPQGMLTLTNDIQARVYAHGLMQLLDWDVIDAQWVYGCKKFKGGAAVKTWPCETRFERDETDRWVKQYVWPLIEFAVALKRAYAEKQLASALLVPHNRTACESSGKFCDAWGHCQLQPSPIALGSLHLPLIPA
jgi:hypothetical protein